MVLQLSYHMPRGASKKRPDWFWKTCQVSSTRQVSSYSVFLSDKRTRLQREITLNWFGGRAALIGAHHSPADEKRIAQLILEEKDLTGFIGSCGAAKPVRSWFTVLIRSPRANARR